MRSLLVLLLAGSFLLVACDDDANKRPRRRRGSSTPAAEKVAKAAESNDDREARAEPTPARRVEGSRALAPATRLSARPSYTQFKKVNARKTEEIEAALKDGWTMVNCGGGIWGSAAGAQSGRGGGGFERCYFVK
jgi:hypothetical protein